MKHIAGALWIFLSAAVYGTSAQSTAAEIQYAANYLKVEVIVETNHDLGRTYTMEIKLTNTGNRKILSQTDWAISFHHRNKIITPTSSTELEVIPAEGCLYVLRPNSNGNYNGIIRNRHISIHVEAEGLMLYKSEIFPNFAIYASTVPPKNILSTRDGMSFVSLAPKNRSIDDMSKLTSMQRMLTWPDVVDEGRVGRRLVIPSPLEISGSSTNIVDLKNSSRWNVYFEATITPGFRTLFKNTLAGLPNMTNVEIREVSQQVPNEDMIFLQQNATAFADMTDDGYRLAIRAKDLSRGLNYNMIHMAAKSETGLHNALQTLLAIFGKFTAAPESTITDDARFAVRSFSLDLTKNLFPLPVLKKLVDLMKMYKLNHLILNLADDHAWRLEVDGIDFPELHTFSSKRCVDQNKCLPPEFGAGADGTTSSSGYLTASAFSDLIKYAIDRNVRVIPKINYLGGLRSAIKASERRFMRIKETDTREANRLYLSAGGNPDTTIPPAESCYTDSVLNPCIPQTEEFIRVINEYIVNLYHTAGVPLVGIHAGGDDGIQLYQTFQACRSQNLDSVALMRKMVRMVQKHNPFTTLVNEEAVVDRTTRDCISPSDSTNTINQQSLVVVFHRDFPGNPDDWNLTQEESDFLFADIEPAMPPSNGTGSSTSAPGGAAFVPDFLRPYTGTRRNIVAPWAKPYTCANAGYMSLLSPEGYFNLESATELDFDAIGDHKKDRYFVINLHRMITFEIMNMYINMDLSNDLTPLLPYRLCRIFECRGLTAQGKQNIIGLQASLDTAVIRNEETLWHKLGRPILMLAEKAWRQAPFENLLDPANITTYEDPELMANRSRGLLEEMTNFLNVFGYKEAGRLDEMKIDYRIGKIGAAINFGLAAFRGPPFPIIVKTSYVGSPIQIRELTGSNTAWRPLFYRDQMGRIAGGYAFTFPQSNQKIELRQLSADGNRAGESIELTLNTHNLVPKEIPVSLRQNACVNVTDRFGIRFEDITPQQWVTMINNIGPAVSEEMQFGQQRIQSLMMTLNDYKQRNMSVASLTLPEVFAGIQELQSQGPNNLYGIYRLIYEQDVTIIEGRERQLNNRYQTWQSTFEQTCPQGQGRAQGQGRGQGRGQGLSPSSSIPGRIQSSGPLSGRK